MSVVMATFPSDRQRSRKECTMTEAPFDELAKGVAREGTRRRLLAGVLGALAAVGRPGGSGARRRMGPVECRERGGTVQRRSSLCHVDPQCGAFQYRWETYCDVGGQDVAFIQVGCAPCPGL
jgi:hypothetical protein